MVLLAACASPGGSGAPSETTGTTAQLSATTTTTGTAVSNGVGDCVVGGWNLDLESLVNSIEAGVSATGRTPTVSATSGSAAVSFDENGGVSGVYDDLTIQTDLGGDSELIDLLLKGQFTGTWSRNVELLVLFPEAESTLAAAPTVPEQSQFAEVGPDVIAVTRSIPWPIEQGSDPSPSGIACEGDTLSITPEVRGSAETIWHRS